MTEEQAEAFAGLMKFVELSGWEIAIHHTDDEEEVPGLVMGTTEYVNDVLDGKYKD